MNLASAYLFGIGIILVILGMYFLYKHHTTPLPNEELAWGGLGENPFKKR